MKCLYATCISFMLCCGVLGAQNMRYIDEVFSDVTVIHDQTYGVNITVLFFPEFLPDTLRFDLYMPEGDTCDSRPLAVVLHTGTFLPKGLTAPTGDKDDYANVQVCERLAKRGYVTASIEYRIGWNPQAQQDIIRRSTIIQAAYRSIQDLYTFLRFMNMTVVDQGNPFRIDTSRVAVFGVGTGGFVGFNAAVVNQVEEIFIQKFINPVDQTPFIDTLLLGDIRGLKPGQINVPNWVGYSGDFHFAFGLDGAVGDSSWMEIGTSVPLVAAGTVNHPTTPFGLDPITGEINCDLPVYTGAGTGLFVVNIAGSACMINKANTLGINDVLNDANFDDPITLALSENLHAQDNLWAINLPGFQAGPWEYWDSTFWKNVPSPLPDFENIHEVGIATNPDMSMDKANRYIDTALWYFSPRAYVALDLANSECETSGLEILQPSAVGFTLMPNPAHDEIRVASSRDYRMRAVHLYDMLGQHVISQSHDNTTVYHIKVDDLAPGLYSLRADFDHGFVSQKVLILHGNE